jgi:hypothetical protein
MIGKLIVEIIIVLSVRTQADTDKTHRAADAGRPQLALINSISTLILCDWRLSVL